MHMRRAIFYKCISKTMKCYNAGEKTMVGLRKIVTLLATTMVVLCLVGIASPAFAQSFGGKDIPKAANMGANANANMGMSKGMPMANQGGMSKGMPMANQGGMSKGMPMANQGGMSKAANAGGMDKYGSSNMGANVGGMAKSMPQANMGMSKGMPLSSNMGANANANANAGGMSKGMTKGGYGGSDMGSVGLGSDY
jgi:hypothetical protein